MSLLCLETNYKHEPTLFLFLQVDLFKSLVVSFVILGFKRFNITNDTNECVYNTLTYKFHVH
jgi:hypothetical protein